MRTHRTQARATAYQQWAHEQRHRSEPLDCEDGFEKIARIEAALLNAYGRDRRLLQAELMRLKAVLGLLPIKVAAE